jgi:chaperonin GroEL (HSP60 family)
LRELFCKPPRTVVAKWESQQSHAISCNASQLEALLTIPKTLAINAALDAIDLLAALRVRRFYHGTMGPWVSPEKSMDVKL